MQPVEEKAPKEKEKSARKSKESSEPQIIDQKPIAKPEPSK